MCFHCRHPCTSNSSFREFEANSVPFFSNYRDSIARITETAARNLSADK